MVLMVTTPRDFDCSSAQAESKHMMPTCKIPPENFTATLIFDMLFQHSCGEGCNPSTRAIMRRYISICAHRPVVARVRTHMLIKRKLGIAVVFAPFPRVVLVIAASKLRIRMSRALTSLDSIDVSGGGCVSPSITCMLSIASPSTMIVASMSESDHRPLSSLVSLKLV